MLDSVRVSDPDWWLESELDPDSDREQDPEAEYGLESGEEVDQGVEEEPCEAGPRVVGEDPTAGGCSGTVLRT